MNPSFEESQGLPQVPVLYSNANTASAWRDPVVSSEPSSVPAWKDGDGKAALNKVLIARSCNIPTGYAPTGFPANATSFFRNENYYPMLPGKHDARGIGNPHAPQYERRIPEQEYERRARRLYREFLKCPGYHRYRTSQPKKGNKKKEAVWPDELEHAFFRALARFPPVGRLKRKPGRGGAKLMGRNEIIADYLLCVTGHERFRKQVSSHIQVLKDYVGKDQILLSYLVSSKEKDKEKKAREDARAEYIIDRVTYSGAHASQHVSAASSREYISSSTHFKFDSFEMFAQLEKVDKKTDTIQYQEVIHFYTKSYVQCQLEDFHFGTAADCAAAYPELASTRLLELSNRNLFAVNASIVLPTMRFNVPAGLDLNLGIRFLVEGPALPRDSCVKSLTTFFINGAVDEENSATGDVAMEETTDPSRWSYQVPFCSKVWAVWMQQLGLQFRQANELAAQPLGLSETHQSRDTQVASIKRDVSNSIQNISAVQEIVATGENGRDPKTILAVHWSFTKADEGDYGRTAWHNLVVPIQEAVEEEEDEDFLNEMHFFESTALCNPTDSFALPPTRYPTIPVLQSPIEFTGCSTQPWVAPGCEETKSEESKVEVSKYEDMKFDSRWLENVQGAAHVDDVFDFGDVPISNPYDTSSTATQFNGECPVVDFEIPTVPNEQLLQEYNQQWTGYENVFDSSGNPTYMASQIDGIYPTPTSTTETKFESFGSQDQQQALAGGSFDVKEEELLDVTLSFDQAADSRAL